MQSCLLLYSCPLLLLSTTKPKQAYKILTESEAQGFFQSIKFYEDDFLSHSDAFASEEGQNGMNYLKVRGLRINIALTGISPSAFKYL